MILAGDIGGTKTNLGLFDRQNGKIVRTAYRRYPSREHAGLDEIVKDFIGAANAKVSAAAFGIAGPVVDGKVRTGNLPWVVDGSALARELGLGGVRLLNDLEAAGYGIGMMQAGDLETLYVGAAVPQAPRVVIAAGTGLGECLLFWTGDKYIPMATEAGHADFAPQTDQQANLWKYIKTHNDFVSAEMVLSGRGFQTLHEFLDSSVRHAGFDDPSNDPAPEITRRALAGECPVCNAAVNLWVEIYGSEAGNLAVRTVAQGGIYVAGGIAVKILPRMKDGRFVAAAQHKEKMTEFLKQVSIQVVLNEDCPLLGAASAAFESA
jgi:glucokinase